MSQPLIYLLIVSLFSVSWLADKLGALPSTAKLIPDLIGGLLALIVAANIIKRRRLDVQPDIGLTFGALVVVLLTTIVVNQIQPGPLVGGVRGHFTFLPFLLLPMAVTLPTASIRKQLLLLLILSLLQVPVTLYQRFVSPEALRTADVIGGTLGANSTGILSVWLACVISILVGFYVNGRLRLAWTLGLIGALLVPMMINETKASLVLIPIALVVPALFSGRHAFGRTALMVVVVGGALAAFVPVYDSFTARDESIVSWIQSDEAREYLYRDSSGGAIEVKRLDSILLALRTLRHENSLLFGLGIGNVSESSIAAFEGEYYARYDHFHPGRTYLTKLLWETGLVGTFSLIAAMAACGIVALRARSSDDPLISALAVGWVGVVAVLGVSLIYLGTFGIPLFACLFWLFSGVLAADRARAGLYHANALHNRSRTGTPRSALTSR